MVSSLGVRFKRILTAFFILSIVAMIGYMVIEGYEPLDAVYMTVITLATVGFSEVKPLSPAGRLWTILVIVMGVGIGAYLFSVFTQYILEGELAGTIRGRRMKRSIDGLSQHFIICGFGRVGEQVARELRELHLSFVVIDRDPELIKRCQELDYLYLQGDAEDDEILRLAGIERARGLVSVLSSDADNVFVVLSARVLKRDLLIVSRATTPDAERKLLKAGADRIVSPYVMAGTQIAGLLVRPNVVGFLDRATLTQQLGLWMEEVQVQEGSHLDGMKLGEADLRGKMGATVLAIVSSRERRTIVLWDADFRLQANDVLIVLARPESIEAVALAADDTRFLRPTLRSPSEVRSR